MELPALFPTFPYPKELMFLHKSSKIVQKSSGIKYGGLMAWLAFAEEFWEALAAGQSKAELG